MLKTAVGVSLVVHAAGLAAVAYLPLLHRYHPEPVVMEALVLNISAVPESANALEPTPKPTVAETQPVAPVVPKPEEPAVRPPEPEPAPIVPKPVEVAPVVALEPETPMTAPAPVIVAKPIEALPAAVANPAPPAVDPGSSGPQASAGQAERIVVKAQPNYRRNAERVYPPAAIRRREEGLVIVTALIDAQGRAQSVEVKKSSGHPLLDSAAINAVRGWEFEPARIDGRAVASPVEVPVNFKLEAQ